MGRRAQRLNSDKADVVFVHQLNSRQPTCAELWSNHPPLAHSTCEHASGEHHFQMYTYATAIRTRNAPVIQSRHVQEKRWSRRTSLRWWQERTLEQTRPRAVADSPPGVERDMSPCHGGRRKGARDHNPSLAVPAATR